jgi:sulfoxide reductase heme-binding subunit YedZ
MNVFAQTTAWTWYLMRGSGAVSLVLLTASIVAGVAVAMRWSGRFSSRLVVEGMHKNLSLLAVAFLAIHVVTAVADSFVSISLIDVIVPFRAGYEPLWIGLGTLVLDLCAALVITSLIRDRIGHRVWRLVHWSAYACWPLAVIHSIGAGTDATQPWLLAVYGLTSAAVAAAFAWRGGAGRRADAPLGSARHRAPTAVPARVPVHRNPSTSHRSVR